METLSRVKAAQKSVFVAPPHPIIRRSAIVAAAAMVFVACGPKLPTPVVTRSDGTAVQRVPEPKKEDEALAQAMAQDAAALAQKGNTAAATAKQDQLLDSYPATLAAARIFQARGEAAEKAGNLEVAISNYEKLLFYRPSYEGADALRERYARLLVAVGRHNDAANMLTAFFAHGSGADKVRFSNPLVDALVGAGRGPDAILVLAEVQGLAEAKGAVHDQAIARALSILDASVSFKDATMLWEKVRGDGSWGALEPALAYKLAKIYYHVRDFKRSEEMLNLVATRYGDSSFGPPAREFMARLQSRFVVDSRAIGVILPLSGKFEQYGKRSLAAIKQAIGSDTTIKLVVKDTKGEPAVVAQAVEDLVLGDHVVAIIGPLFANEALSAAQKAEELSVPLLALSFREGLPEIGPFVFRTALTVEAQAKELARVSFEELGFSRFALLYPRNSYGLEFVHAFWDEVDRRKGEVRAAEIYENDQTTFTESVKRLVGRWYLAARSDFRESLSELRAKKLPPHRVQAEVEKLQKRLPPVVDFDAIIIPDSSQKIGLIAPALAVEDIVTTHDPKELEKIKKATSNANIHPVTLLGASTWNHQQTVESCERYCEGAVFVDAFYPDSPEPKVRDFVAGFHDATGVAPQLSEAQAFDTAGLLRNVLNEKRPSDRAAMRDALSQVSSYEGVTGRLGFDGSGEAKKNLFILTILDGAIRRWQKAASPPQG